MGSERSESGRLKKVEKRRRERIQNPLKVMNHELSQFDWVWDMNYNPSFFKEKEHCEDHMILNDIQLCPTNPVESVSWNEIMKFLKKFNYGYDEKFRLPTNQEWEYIARGGKNTTYFFGNDSNDLEEICLV